MAMTIQKFHADEVTARVFRGCWQCCGSKGAAVFVVVLKLAVAALFFAWASPAFAKPDYARWWYCVLNYHKKKHQGQEDAIAEVGNSVCNSTIALDFGLPELEVELKTRSALLMVLASLTFLTSASGLYGLFRGRPRFLLVCIGAAVLRAILVVIAAPIFVGLGWNRMSNFLTNPIAFIMAYTAFAFADIAFEWPAYAVYKTMTTNGADPGRQGDGGGTTRAAEADHEGAAVVMSALLGQQEANGRASGGNHRPASEKFEKGRLNDNGDRQ